MGLVDIDGCAVPTDLRDIIKGVKQRTGATLQSCYRGSDAKAILNKHGKHTQQQIWDASPSQRAAMGVRGTPNRPGQSTHELCSDGVAYRGPVGRKLDQYQCGMDWPDASIPAVIAAFRALGAFPIHPYPTGAEYHHINLAKAPKRVWSFFLPLKYGDSGMFVWILSSRLKNAGYLKQGVTSKFDRNMHGAVTLFQERHHLPVDGVVGDHTWLNIQAAERAAKKKK